VDLVAVAVAIAAISGVVAVRHYAIRRVALHRDGRFVWLMFPIPALGALASIWIALNSLSTPVPAILIGGFGFLMLGLLVYLLMGLRRALMTADATGDITELLMRPIEKYMTALAGLMLIGAAIGVVLLILLLVLYGPPGGSD
jgi:hypothetical protein